MDRIAEIKDVVRNVSLYGWSHCPKQGKLLHYVEYLLSELEQAQQDLKVANETNKRLNDNNLMLVKREQKLIEGVRMAFDLLEEHQPQWYLRKHYWAMDGILKELGVTAE